MTRSSTARMRVSMRAKRRPQRRQQPVRVPERRVLPVASAADVVVAAVARVVLPVAEMPVHLLQLCNLFLNLKCLKPRHVRGFRRFRGDSQVSS